jgi:hypothetical protein
MTQDLKFALRQLIKAPGFNIAAIVVLALGIGANSAVFGLVQTLLFKSPGYAEPSQIVQLFSQDRKNPKTFRSFSYPTYRDVREHNTVFADAMAYTLAMVGIGEKGDTRRAYAGVVSANYFSVLGIASVQCRAFLPEEETPGRNARVAIVSHGYWKRNGAIRAARLPRSRSTAAFSIVGIMPGRFTARCTSRPECG